MPGSDSALRYTEAGLSDSSPTLDVALIGVNVEASVKSSGSGDAGNEVGVSAPPPPAKEVGIDDTVVSDSEEPLFLIAGALSLSSSNSPPSTPPTMISRDDVIE